MGVATDVGKDVGKDVGQSVIKDIGKDVAHDVSIAVAHDVATSTAKDVAHDVSIATAKDALKDTGKSALKDTGKSALKDTGKSALKDTGKSIGKDAAENAFKDGAKKGSKYASKVALAVGLGIGGYIIGSAIINTEKRNGEKFNVTSIVDSTALLSGDYTATITFSPGETVLLKDTVTISDSTSNPKIDGDYPIVAVISATQFTIKVVNKVFATGTANMVLHTSFDNQLKDQVASASSTVGSAAGGVASGVAGGVSAAGGGFLSGLGFSPTYIAIICCLIVLFIIAGFVVYNILV